MTSIKERERSTIQSGLSIVLPTFNGSGSISQAIGSLLHLGTDLPREMIVVDDDSRDGTPDPARALAQTDEEY